jgi:hypothetical protein
VFITRRNHAVPVVAHDLEYKSLLAAPDDVESNDFIIDLYPFDPDPLRCLFVGRFQIYWLFSPSSIMKAAVIATDRHYIVRIALVPALFAVRDLIVWLAGEFVFQCSDYPCVPCFLEKQPLGD